MSIVVQTAGQPAPSESQEKVESQNKEVVEANENKEEMEASDESNDEAADNDDESDESQDESNDEDGAKDDAKPKRKNGFKKRIEKLNRRVSEKEQEIDYWKKEALKQKQSPQEEAAQSHKPDLSDKPKADNFDSSEEYEDALFDWKLEQREKQNAAKQKENQLKTEYQKQAQTHQSRVEEFKKQQPDYLDVVSEFIEDHGDVKFSPGLEESILSSEHGPAVIYELVKDKKEFDRINSLSPLAAAREIGKIEARLSKSLETKEIKKQTNAPKPISPVGSGGSSSKKDINDPNLTQQEYEKLRREQMRKNNA